MRDRRDRSTLQVLDQVRQASLALLERPGRTSLSLSLVAIGAALIVVVTALGATASVQVSARFDALRATTVELGLAQGIDATSTAESLADMIPDDATERMDRLRNVEASGTLLFRQTDAEVAISPLAISDTPALVGQRTILSDPGLERAARLKVTGRWMSANDLKEDRLVAVIGSVLAKRLGLQDPGGTLFVDGRAYSLIGIVEASPLRPDVLDSVVLPRQSSARSGAEPITTESVVILQVRPGAAQAVAGQAPIQLHPDKPNMFSAAAAQDPKDFRETLEADTAAVMKTLASAGVALGTLATLLVWWSSVGARQGVIGLWIAMGATRIHVFRLILTECLIGGLAAGLIGAAIGAIAVSVVCVFQDWQLVMSPWLLPVTILGTVGVGGLAGCLPAWHAARVNPVTSLSA